MARAAHEDGGMESITEQTVTQREHYLKVTRPLMVGVRYCRGGEGAELGGSNMKQLVSNFRKWKEGVVAILPFCW